MNTRLGSWKEIANYLNKGVRTVQRWEADGLPVRRPNPRNCGIVMAMSDDLDVWLKSRAKAKPAAPCNDLILACRESRDANRNLRYQRRALVAAIHEQRAKLEAEIKELRKRYRKE